MLSGHLQMDTLRNNLKITQTVFGRVFTKGRYLVVSSAIFVTGVSLVLLLSNLGLLQTVFVSESISFGEKLVFLFSLYGSLVTNFTLLNAFSIILVIVLFSIDLTLLVFYIRRTQKAGRGFKRSRAKSLVGALSGVLGIGCAACGSVILTGVATALGATGLLLALPLHGGEFAFVGIVLLLWSIAYLVKKISDPLVCPAKS